MDFSALPKVELHLHLDCSLSFAAVSQIDPSVTLQAYQQDFNAPEKFTNLADFFQRAPKGTALMQTEEQLRLVTFDVTSQSLTTVKLVERFQGKHVGGIDLGAYEAGYPIFAHIPAFQYAAQQGIPRTVHAGEARGPDSVWETLKNLRPSRIGHGVRSIEDPALIAHLKQERIHLEVCPTSNVQINLFDTYAHHPINTLYEEGLSVGVNTDTRMIANVTLTQEYEKLHSAFGWDKQHFRRCNLNALSAAFLPEDVKARLEKQVRAGYQ